MDGMKRKWGSVVPGLLVYALFGRCDDEAGRRAPPGAACLWLADRAAGGGGAIICLDADLAEVERARCRAPLALASRSAQVCTVAVALDGSANGGQALLWLEEGREIGSVPVAGTVRALVAIGEHGRDALALIQSGDGSVLLQRHAVGAGLGWEFDAPLGVALDACGARAVVGAADGRVELVRLEFPPALEAARVLASPVVGVALREDSAGAWVTLADGTLARLGPGLEIERVCGPFGADPLVECGAEGAWLLDRSSAVLVRVDADGAIRARTDLAPEHPIGLCVLQDGRAVVALRGGVIAVERDGRVSASAGGFEALAALEVRWIRGDL
jgi:hypothetical protein